MKLYTRTGDDGTTGRFGGERVEKDARCVEASGTVDELNCHVGLALAACGDDELTQALTSVQQRLFELGADLAAPRPAGAEQTRQAPRIESEHITEIERLIDEACAPLAPLRTFILPGGCELAARLHVARAVCRRAERCCVALQREEPVNPLTVVYLNRLSDLLFALARQANQLAGVPDTPWPPGSPGTPGSPESPETPDPPTAQ